MMAGRLSRSTNLGLFAATVVLLWFAAIKLYATWTVTFAPYHGVDLAGYLAGVDRWLATGSPYKATEVAGAFSYQPDTFLHPPIAVVLFLPFVALPGILWWLIPLGTVAFVIASFRPVLWVWPVMALCLVVSRFSSTFTVGNTDLWVWAMVAAALRWRWPAVLILIKPSLIPLAVIGIRDRRWLIAAAIVALVSLSFGTLWFQWLRVVINSPGDLMYSIGSLPLMLIPVVAWRFETHHAQADLATQPTAKSPKSRRIRPVSASPMLPRPSATFEDHPVRV